MRIGLVTPAPLDSRRGNAVTARRWEGILRDLGHDPHLVEVPSEPDPSAPLPTLDHDLLIALHARRSAPAVMAFRQAHPSAPLVIAMTGTDLYADLETSPQSLTALKQADRVVVLQERGLKALPAAQRTKGRVIHQGVEVARIEAQPRPDDVFRVLVLAHLRPVKVPLLTAQAARLVPAESRLEVLLLGAPLDPELAEAARAEAKTNARFRWGEEVPRREALGALTSAHLLALTSLMEGGANAVGEALALGVPVVSTRIEGSLGLLGADYPGYFPTDDAPALAALLWRAEHEPAFYEELRARCEARRELFDPARERQAWSDLLAELAS